MNINNLIETLAADNSRNFKIDYLRSNYDNELLKKVITLALDPFVNFYIRKIPNYVPAQPNQADTLDSVLDSLEMLSSRQVTGNAGIEYLTKLLSSVTEDDGKVIERVIGKDLKCGVSVSTVNKVWKDLIQEFPCMLCSQYEQRLVDKISYPAYVQRKEDGMRVCVIVRNGAVEFRTRNGKELDLLGNLQEEFIAISDGKDVVFDGELLIKDNGVIIDRKTGNGILMKSQRGTLSIKEASMVNVIVWDMIPYDKFIDEKYTTPYLDRFNSLCLIKMPEKISVVDTEVVSSLEEARSIFEDYLSKGFEGIILKDFKGIWENKRSKTQIKFKGELECDVKIVGIQEGTVGSKYEGMLGALVCESSDSVVKVSVGSGFTDDQRKELMKENLIGKIVAIKYNSRIVSKTGEHSIFLPIFIEIREDKDIADSSANIK